MHGLSTYFQFKVTKAKAYSSLELNHTIGLNIERPLRSPPSPDLSRLQGHHKSFRGIDFSMVNHALFSKTGLCQIHF